MLKNRKSVFWSEKDQLNQADTQKNYAGKYLCSTTRNGPARLENYTIPGKGAGKVLLRDKELYGACFRKSDLRNVEFDNADLSGANFYKADLTGASFVGADLTGAIFDCANLQKADFSGANLSNANLHRAVVKSAAFNFADLSKVRFEPIELSNVRYFYAAQGLEKMRFGMTADALYSLREMALESGQRPMERQITYAIEREKNNDRNPIHQAIVFVLFDLTCQFGMSPGRPILIIFILVGLFSVPYMLALAFPQKDHTGIWRSWPKDSMLKQKSLPQHEKIVAIGLAVPMWALYFSLLSAFHMGWQELNVGNWIARIAPVEYAVKATGWPKVFSGMQSLISMYLLALWVLTSFGNPFQ